MKKTLALLVFLFLFLVQSFTPTAAFAANTSAKKGVGGEGDPDLTKLGVSWAYAWYICQDCFANKGYEHVPMISVADYDPATVTKVARDHQGSYWLIWNEPNYHEQANISPTEAAQIYRVLRPLIKNADPTAKLIVGGVLWLDVGWLGNFRNEYHRLYNEWPVVEGWHVHQYFGGTEYGLGKTVTPTEWRRRLEAVHNWMDNPDNGGPVELWLTEYGCLNSEPIAYQIMQDQVPWLEAQPWLTRYAWYVTWSAGEYCPNCTGALFTIVAPYDLTRLGQYYASIGNPVTPTPTPTFTPDSSLADSAKATLVYDQKASNRSRYSGPLIYPAFRWATNNKTGLSFVPVIYLFGDQLIGGTQNPGISGKLFSINRNTGLEIWNRDFPIYGSGSIAQNGTFYNCQMNTDVCSAVNLNNGSLKWSYSFGHGHGNNQTLIGNDGTVYTTRQQALECSSTCCKQKGYDHYCL